MSEFSKRLVAWQRREGRNELPWSGSRDPYRVWLSEVMLQQTQVATVRGHYARFLERWPQVQDLAAATLDEVLAQWAGLGYYSRARNLHACAQAVAALGAWPQASAELEQLPGIGRSTARAISSFCFDERVSILDGNVKRVLSRLLAFDADLASSKAQRELWVLADELVPDSAHAADMPSYTQGLMDLGATVCVPRTPRCLLCPVESLCKGQARAAELPRITKKLKRSQRENWWLWLQRADGASWLQQRPTPGVWAGLWTLPLLDSEADVERLVGPDTQPLPRINHVLTHLDWVLHPRLAQWSGGDPPLEGRWVAREELPAYGLPAPLKKLFG